MYEHI
jgi:hypothetical protein